MMDDSVQIITLMVLISQHQTLRVSMIMQMLMIDYGLIILTFLLTTLDQSVDYISSQASVTRHNEYIGPWSAVMQEISMSEMHMYHAEATQTGNLAGAAAILNDPAGNQYWWFT